MTVVAANSGFYGGGMHIAPGASPHDGLLDVVVVAAASKAALVRALPKLYDGTHLELDEVWVLRGRDVRIRSDRPVVAYGDGEPVGDLPLTVTVRPAALRVLA
jgi:diacylglycerol kinase family enzyme